MKLLAHAKVNFTLEVLGERSDGYHALRSVVVPISLADTLEIEPPEDGSITSDTGFSDDLCVKAACVLANLQPSTFNLQPALGARIRVTKRIPAGGGLGGGSADAAAVLLGLNDLWRLGLSRTELAEIGAQVGSDVPSLVLGCPVLMEGRGEKVSPLFNLQPSTCPSLNLVLVHPEVFSSTKEVYAACVPRATGGTSATDEMIAALSSGDFGRICAALANDLQEPAVRLHPEIADAMTSLRTAGAEGVMMTGSGSCVFGLVPDDTSAKRIAAELSARGLKSWALRTLEAS